MYMFFKKNKKAWVFSIGYFLPKLQDYIRDYKQLFVN